VARIGDVLPIRQSYLNAGCALRWSRDTKEAELKP